MRKHVLEIFTASVAGPGEARAERLATNREDCVAISGNGGNVLAC